MAFPVFDPSVKPVPGSIEVEPRVLRPDFGVGFSRAADGVEQTIYSGSGPSTYEFQRNTQPQILPSVRWENISTAEKEEIIAFMQERHGYKPFTWQIPGQSVSRTYTCPRWETERVAPDVWSVVLRIEQVFDH